VIISVTALVFIGLVTAGVMLWRERSSSAGPLKIASIAVLPFKPLVVNNRDESLELGMADSMIAKLSSGDVQVRPLAAVRRYNAVDQDPINAGRELGVEAVLDGSIQLANDRVRISATLIRVSDGKQLWAGQYNERSADIFGLQDSISERVASALQIALGEKARKSYTASVEAYQLFSRGSSMPRGWSFPKFKRAFHITNKRSPLILTMRWPMSSLRMFLAPWY
jgi:serine/threonine-protein kinase